MPATRIPPARTKRSEWNRTATQLPTSAKALTPTTMGISAKADCSGE